MYVCGTVAVYDYWLTQKLLSCDWLQFFQQQTNQPSDHPTKATHRSSLPELKNKVTSFSDIF